MNCNEVMEYMQRHLDGDLNREEQNRLHGHLRSCPECAEMMDRLVRIDQDLANLPKVVPPFSLVDAILPRLEQIDAEMRREATDPAAIAASGGEGPDERKASRLLRFRRDFLRYGGMAAAAVVLGVLIVNGLPDSFGGSRQWSSLQETSGGGSSMANIMMSAETDASSASGQFAPTGKPSSFAADMGSPAADAGSAKAGQPAAEAANGKGNAASPELLQTQADRPAEPEASSMKESKGQEVGVSEVSSGAAPATETPALHDWSKGGAEAHGGGNAAGGAEAAAPDEWEGGTVYGYEVSAMDQLGEDAVQEQVVSEDGRFAAFVQHTEDGRIAVHIDRLDGRNDEDRYVSNYQWDPAEAVVEVLGWSGTTVTYTVETGGAKRTFAIDAAAGTEAEIE